MVDASTFFVMLFFFSGWFPIGSMEPRHRLVPLEHLSFSSLACPTWILFLWISERVLIAFLCTKWSLNIYIYVCIHFLKLLKESITLYIYIYTHTQELHHACVSSWWKYSWRRLTSSFHHPVGLAELLELFVGQLYWFFFFLYLCWCVSLDIPKFIGSDHSES